MKELNFVRIGEQIQRRRRELHLTQNKVAQLLEVNPSHVSNIECGRANPSLTALVNIASILSCSVDYFLNDEYSYDYGFPEGSLSLDHEIQKRLKYCDKEKKQRILKMIDLM